MPPSRGLSRRSTSASRTGRWRSFAMARSPASFAVAVRTARECAALFQRAPARFELVGVESGGLPDLEARRRGRQRRRVRRCRRARSARWAGRCGLRCRREAAWNRRRSSRQVVMLVGEQVDLVDVLADSANQARSPQWMAGCLKEGSATMPWKGCAGELLAKWRRHRYAPLAIELVDECVEEQSHGSGRSNPLYQRIPALLLGGTPSRVPPLAIEAAIAGHGTAPQNGRPAARHRGDLRLTCGISWDDMGVNGKP